MGLVQKQKIVFKQREETRLLYTFISFANLLLTQLGLQSSLLTCQRLAWLGRPLCTVPISFHPPRTGCRWVSIFSYQHLKDVFKTLKNHNLQTKHPIKIMMATLCFLQDPSKQDYTWIHSDTTLLRYIYLIKIQYSLLQSRPNVLGSVNKYLAFTIKIFQAWKNNIPDLGE